MRPLLRNGQYNFDACVATATLAAAAVVLRFIVRRKLKQAISISEWLCLLSLALFYAYCGAIIYYIVHLSPNGNGNFDAAKFTSPLQLIPLLKILFISEMFFSCAITSVKISILCFYYTLFQVVTAFRRALYVTGAICIIWLITVLFVVIFQCSPIHAFWDSVSSPMYCKASANVLLGYEVSNLIIDVIILLLPVMVIRTLHLPLWRKLSVAVVFLLGGFVCVASIVRITRIWRMPNPAVDIHLPTVIMWSTIQLGTGIICACLPTYGPLLKSEFIDRVFKRLLSSFRSEKEYPSSFGYGKKHHERTPPPDGATHLAWTRIEEGKSMDSMQETGNFHGHIAMEPVSSRDIVVSKSVHVS